MVWWSSVLPWTLHIAKDRLKCPRLPLLPELAFYEPPSLAQHLILPVLCYLRWKSELPRANEKGTGTEKSTRSSTQENSALGASYLEPLGVVGSFVFLFFFLPFFLAYHCVPFPYIRIRVSDYTPPLLPLVGPFYFPRPPFSYLLMVSFWYLCSLPATYERKHAALSFWDSFCT